jgi:sucrose-phosphate synthase
LAIYNSWSLCRSGDSVALLSGALNVPMVLTGHSLARNKLEQLLKGARQSKEVINSTYMVLTGHSLARNKLEQHLKGARQSKEFINSTYRIM